MAFLASRLLPVIGFGFFFLFGSLDSGLLGLDGTHFFLYLLY
jgi:hypothetical protein